jgi:hypothetical protein
LLTTSVDDDVIITADLSFLFSSSQIITITLNSDGISSKIERRPKRADPENINLMLIAIKWEFTSASILQAYHANL